MGKASVFDEGQQSPCPMTSRPLNFFCHALATTQWKVEQAADMSSRAERGDLLLFVSQYETADACRRGDRSAGQLSFSPAYFPTSGFTRSLVNSFTSNCPSFFVS